MTARIHLSAPDVTDAEERAVVRAIRSGWVAPLGPEVDAFESELAAYCDREYAVALSSGTTALHLALIGLGVGPGDLVATATMTFAATVNAITYVGAEPILIDCDDSATLNPHLLAQAVVDPGVTGGRPIAAVLPVDLFGKVADQQAIARIAQAHGIPVISDAAESLGARRAGRAAGSYGVAAALSFNGNKIMTTSGGGALLTDDPALAERARYLATQARAPVVHYEHTDIGYNYRLSNVLAALGRAQLERLPAMMERRRQVRAGYRELFADVPGVRLLGEPSGAPDGATHDNWWLTCILIDPQVAGFTAEHLRLALAEADIEARPLWKPMHQQPVFARARRVVDGTSDRLFATGLSLPSGSLMRAADIERIHTVVRAVVTGRHRDGRP